MHWLCNSLNTVKVQQPIQRFIYLIEYTFLQYVVNFFQFLWNEDRCTRECTITAEILITISGSFWLVVNMWSVLSRTFETICSFQYEIVWKSESSYAKNFIPNCSIWRIYFLNSIEISSSSKFVIHNCDHFFH